MCSREAGVARGSAAMFGPDGSLDDANLSVAARGGVLRAHPADEVISPLCRSRAVVDVSREPIPTFALPKSVEPFTQTGAV